MCSFVSIEMEIVKEHLQMNFRNKSVSLQNVFLSKILNSRLFPQLTSVRSNSSIRARLSLTFSYIAVFLTSTRRHCLLECGKGLLLSCYRRR